MIAQFLWMVAGTETPGPIIEKDEITEQDARQYALPDNATSGVLRVEGGPEWPCPARDYLAITDVQLRTDEGKRRELIRSLRAAAFWALVGAGVPANTAYGYGQQFVGRYGRELDAYILGSAPDFHFAMKSAPEPWLEEKADPERTIRQLFLASIPEPSVSPTPPNYISAADRDQMVARIEAATTVAATKGILRDLIQILCPA